jgi:hypothetical protein
VNPIGIAPQEGLSQQADSSVSTSTLRAGQALPENGIDVDVQSRGTKRQKSNSTNPTTNSTLNSTAEPVRSTTLAPSPKPKRTKSRAPTPNPTEATQETVAPVGSDNDDGVDGTGDDGDNGDNGDNADTIAPVASEPQPVVAPVAEASSPIVAPFTAVPETIAPKAKVTTSPPVLPRVVPTPSPTNALTDPPTPQYVPIDDDPILNQEIKEEDDKDEQELQNVEKEAKTAGGIGFLLALLAMVFTAHQMSENPDGIYASVCRLAITVVGCALKLVLMPCRNLMGNRYHAGHIPVSTMEYREPYRGGSAGMEMT